MILDRLGQEFELGQIGAWRSRVWACVRRWRHLASVGARWRAVGTFVSFYRWQRADEWF